MTDQSLDQLRQLWMDHQGELSFDAPVEFFLSKDGGRWLRQVSYNPNKFSFTDVAIKLMNEGKKG